MQLRKPRRGRVSQALALMTANLLAAVGAHAQDASAGPMDTAQAASVTSDTETDLGYTRIDSAVLFYQEAGGRVRAIEPTLTATLNGDSGDVLSVGLVADTLTGATPNGAMPWKQSQTFVTPAHPPSTTATVTTASGGSTLVTISGTGIISRQYVVAPNTLPVDTGFRDQRWGLNLGYSTLWNSSTRLSVGGSASNERDYTSVSLTAGVAESFNQNMTTAAASVDFEYDLSRPFFGTPTPFTVMSADQKGPNASKTVASLVVGVTQVMNRYWLAQLNYSVGTTNGYQTDPYRILSVVDPISGAPLQYLYEGRPGSRIRQSLYFANKLAIGPTFADVSARAYIDSWGIKSVTAEVSDRIPLTSRLFIEPGGRYYTQTAASFFRNYLVSGQPLPKYASSDSRLGAFSAVTWGLRAGYDITPHAELYVQGESYKQTGVTHPPGAIGDLATQNLFSGASATSVVLGFSFAFY